MRIQYRQYRYVQIKSNHYLYTWIPRDVMGCDTSTSTCLSKSGLRRLVQMHNIQHFNYNFFAVDIKVHQNQQARLGRVTSQNIEGLLQEWSESVRML